MGDGGWSRWPFVFKVYDLKIKIKIFHFLTVFTIFSLFSLSNKDEYRHKITFVMCIDIGIFPECLQEEN